MIALKQQEKKEKVMLTIAVILMIVGFLNSIRGLVINKITITSVGTVIEYILIIVYATILYKKPHGNLLKILIMIFGFIFAYFAIDSFQSDKVSAILSSTVVVLVSFMAGRLNRYKQNVIISLIVLAMLVGMGVKDYCVMNANKSEPREIGVVAEVDENDENMLEDLEKNGEHPWGHAEEMKPAPADKDGNMPNGMTILSSVISFMNMSIMWMAIFSGYCSRYRKHAQTGMLDQ